MRMQEYRYRALKSQVNPHFLFNSLNILYALVRTGSDKSLSFIESLSNIYRYVLSHQNLDLVTLESELDFANDYLQILSLRYVDSITVNYDIPQHIENSKLVPFTMQILLENVVKHNSLSKTQPMEIDITVANDHLVVSNNLRPKKNVDSGGTGLKYLTQLYEMRGSIFRVLRTADSFIVYVPLI